MQKFFFFFLIRGLIIYIYMYNKKDRDYTKQIHKINLKQITNKEQLYI